MRADGMQAGNETGAAQVLGGDHADVTRATLRESPGAARPERI